jgi:hypothetical protein
VQEVVVLPAVTQRVQSQHRGLRRARHRREPQTQGLRSGGVWAQEPHSQLCQPTGRLGGRVRTCCTEAREVGIGVEHDHAQVGAQQQLLQNDAEGIGLPGTALTAEERVASEASAPEPGRYLDAARAPTADGQCRVARVLQRFKPQT